MGTLAHLTMGKIVFLLAYSAFLAVPLAQAQDRCEIPDTEKYDCAPVFDACEAKGCCWVPADKHRDTPWCFYGTDQPSPDDYCKPEMFNWEASDPGFSDSEHQTMYSKYEANLNIDGTGAIVAAPDHETPGGDYYYHWMRDAGLSIKAWMDINHNDIDVRIEPKFTIEDQEPYTGGWCRPQTDGPALRAMAMAKWGKILLDNGHDDEAKGTIWPLIKFDLEWVTENWQSTGCDLWEEVRSDDFFFNRMAFIYCLNAAADFADQIGEGIGSSYRTVAEDIKSVIVTHWNGKYLTESENRPDDGAVIHAITTFGKDLYQPDSEECAATIKYLARAFCREYPINQQENESGDPGVLIGRYPNDSYAGGNPWQLLTAVFAECFYVGGKTSLDTIRREGNMKLLTSKKERWMDLLNLEEGATLADLAAAQIAAGDAVMTRLHNHVKDDGGKIDEQIDKNTGKQASAEDLTWSYANILHALHIRKGLAEDLDKLKNTQI